MTATVVIPAQRDAADRWEIVTRAQQGDRDAFADLYRLYAGTVFRFVHARTGNRHLTEDITGDVFVRALRSIGGLTWQSRDPGAWLITVARNLIADHYKSSRYQRELTVGDIRDDVDRADLSPEGDPAAAVVDHDINLTLLAAVKALNAEQQECIRLRFLCGLSVAETAQAMGKQEGAIKALQYRATKALGRLLDGQGLGPPSPRPHPAPGSGWSPDRLLVEHRRRSAAGQSTAEIAVEMGYASAASLHAALHRARKLIREGQC